MGVAFKQNRLLLYRTLYKIGGKDLVQELNYKGCPWLHMFHSKELYKNELLDKAFNWRSSVQGHYFWVRINKELI